nr:hypothetical protein E2R29_01420 [Burkholderia pseudomallei]
MRGDRSPHAAASVPLSLRPTAFTLGNRPPCARSLRGADDSPRRTNLHRRSSLDPAQSPNSFRLPARRAHRLATTRAPRSSAKRRPRRIVFTVNAAHSARAATVRPRQQAHETGSRDTNAHHAAQARRRAGAARSARSRHTHRCPRRSRLKSDKYLHPTRAEP